MLIGLNIISLLILLPAMIALDVRRVFANKFDLVCCLGKSSATGVNNAAADNAKNERCNRRTAGGGFNRDLMNNRDDDTDLEHSLADNNLGKSSGAAVKCAQRLTISRFARDYYGRAVASTPFKLTTLVAAVGLLGAAAWGINTGLEDGLDLAELVPRNTSVAAFLAAEDRYFGFYNMYAVTGAEVEYPENQALLHQYHNAFVRVANIIKDDNGGLPEFWLSLFRGWLLRLQTAFDADFAAGHIDEEGWRPAASDDGILAYKLLVQTGHVDYPVDKSLLRTTRYVNEKCHNDKKNLFR